MELILIRHFATPGNRKRQYIGKTDEPIDTACLPDPMPAYPDVDVLAVSPMRRCAETADRIYPGKERIVCPLFREMDFGAYEGKTYEELKEEPAYVRWLASGGLTAFPGGEERERFEARCREGMEVLLKQLTSRAQTDQLRAGIVAHGGTIMALMAAYDCSGRGFYDWQIRNGEAILVSVDVPRWKQGERCFREIRTIRREEQ